MGWADRWMDGWEAVNMCMCLRRDEGLSLK